VRAEDFDQWADSFAAFHAHFGTLFGRRETRDQAGKYLRGLLAPIERKNSWQVAEAIGDATPDRTQRLLGRVDWDANAARDILEDFVSETFGDPEGIGVVDETGILKKGTGSVGVQRQYSGTAGKVENCQMATVLTYASAMGHVCLDRRLYLPEGWCEDKERRKKVKVPDEIVFQTKPEQAVAMLEHAWERGVPMRWVTGDEVYGDAPRLRQSVQAHGRWYVLAVSSTTPIWRERPLVEEPGPSPRGRPRTKVRLAPDASASTSVSSVVRAWSSERWERFSVAEGEKGPRLYDWGRERVIESRDQLPGPEVWLMARRSINTPTEIAYYLAWAPPDTTLPTLARVAATRYTVEQCIEEAKGEVGFDHYQVRFWPSWHRHITLVMMAHAWLASIKTIEAQKGGTFPTTWQH